mmetsp:Transcript_42552/g.121742  ORF Transcript_42552/g.121742 Transcript_42552/m.121742 type:complete len:204 (-) Transcript_42552:3-614(-)
MCSTSGTGFSRSRSRSRSSSRSRLRSVPPRSSRSRSRSWWCCRSSGGGGSGEDATSASQTPGGGSRCLPPPPPPPPPTSDVGEAEDGDENPVNIWQGESPERSPLADRGLGASASPCCADWPMPGYSYFDGGALEHPAQADAPDANPTALAAAQHARHSPHEFPEHMEAGPHMLMPKYVAAWLPFPIGPTLECVGHLDHQWLP